MTENILLNRRRALTLGAGLLGSAAVGGAALAQSGPPLDGRFASQYYMQFPRGEKVPTSVAAQGYNFPVEIWDANGRSYTVDDFKGKVTLIQFWRSRCEACHYEVPALDVLAPQLESPDFQIIAVALMEDSEQDIRRFYQRHNIRNLPVYQDRDHLAFSQIAPEHPSYGVRSTPTTVLIDRNGNYISAYSGAPGWERPEGKALLKWYINNG